MNEVAMEEIPDTKIFTKFDDNRSGPPWKKELISWLSLFFHFDEKSISRLLN